MDSNSDVRNLMVNLCTRVPVGVDHHMLRVWSVLMLYRVVFGPQGVYIA